MHALIHSIIEGTPLGLPGGHGRDFPVAGYEVSGILRRWVLAGAAAGTLACATPNPNVRAVRLSNGIIQVDGPLAGPFKTTEELASNGCELMTSQPGAGAMHGKLGKEYCALHYYSQDDQSYYLTYLSDIGGDGPDGTKYCNVPKAINELNQRKHLITGPAHNHPHNRQFSPQDLGAARPKGWSPVGPSRVVDPDSRQILERELYVFFKDLNEVCFSYRYNYATRIVSALREGRWVPIGEATGDWGSFKPIEGAGWQP